MEPLEFLRKQFPRNFRFYDADLTRNIDKVFQKEKGINAVLHYAAKCLVNESMESPEKYFGNNVGGSLNLLAAMAKYNVKNIVFSSTCAVYGEAEYTPVDEKHPLAPANPYGASQKMVEEIINWYKTLKGINYVILRYFNVCGASEDGEIGDSKKPSVLLVQNAVRGALGIDKFFLTCPKVNPIDLNRAHILQSNIF
jgi:UDP-glucose 4-epimerase